MSENKYLVVSTSLNPGSRSRLLARKTHEALDKLVGADWIDLQEIELPFCDGDKAGAHPNVARVRHAIESAAGIIMAVPIYNYASGAAAKNLIELTGRAWSDKVVGFLCAAGGKSSYMSIMSLANSLMLDFRTIVIPAFVYADGSCFEGGKIVDEDVNRRVGELAEKLTLITGALKAKE